jgi:NhaP-type Na+/H+ or K+/H+ antiporter
LLCSFTKKTEDAHFQEVIELLLNLSFFIIFGFAFPWAQFADLGIGKLIGMAVAVMLLKRIPMVLLFKKWTPVLRTWREAMFAGWFGPIGVGGVWFALHALNELGDKKSEFTYIKPVMYFLVLSSVIMHGMTVPLFNLGLDSIGAKRNGESQVKVNGESSDAAEQEVAVEIPEESMAAIKA